MKPRTLLALAALGVALACAVLLFVKGFSTTLLVGLVGSAWVGLRLASMGGPDRRAVAAAIHERARQNLDRHHGSPEA